MIEVFHSTQHHVACVMNSDSGEILTAVIQPIYEGDTNNIQSYLLTICTSTSDNTMSIYYTGDISNVELNVTYDESHNDLDIAVCLNDGNCNVQYRLNKDYKSKTSKITYGEMLCDFLNKEKKENIYCKEEIKPTDIVNYAKDSVEDYAEFEFLKLLRSAKKKKQSK